MPFARSQRGETQLTYALVLVLIAIGAIVAIALFGKGVQGLLSHIHSSVSAVFPGAPTTVEEGEEGGEEEVGVPNEPGAPTPSPSKKPKRKPPKKQMPTPY